MQALSAASVDAQAILALLWQRVRQRGELPGFSRVVSAILRDMRGDDHHEFNMTRAVLSDPALTQKVLRLANSPMYAVFGQQINTVTKAVAVLGPESIGHLALGLKLIDGLSVASPATVTARNEMEKAVLAGHIGRQVGSLAGSRDAEEAGVCAMLHALGNIMVSFYLPELWHAMQCAREAHEVSEADAAVEILGVGLDQIARAVAQHWGLPSNLLNTLKNVMPAISDAPLEHNDWLAAVASMSLACADAVFQDADVQGCTQTLERIAQSYAFMLGIGAPILLGAVRTARQLARDESAPLPMARNADQRPAHGLPASPTCSAPLR